MLAPARGPDQHREEASFSLAGRLDGYRGPGSYVCRERYLHTSLASVLSLKRDRTRPSPPRPLCRQLPSYGTRSTAPDCNHCSAHARDYVLPTCSPASYPDVSQCETGYVLRTYEYTSSSRRAYPVPRSLQRPLDPSHSASSAALVMLRRYFNQPITNGVDGAPLPSSLPGAPRESRRSPRAALRHAN